MKKGFVSVVFVLSVLGCSDSSDPSPGADSPDLPASPPVAPVVYKWTSGWTKHSDSFFFGQRDDATQLGFASDPSVVKDGDIYRMFYACLDKTLIMQTGRDEDLGPGICQVTSSDARNWVYVNEIEQMVKGRVLAFRDGEWDENLETPEAIQQGDLYFLYYSGYENGQHPTIGLEGFPSHLGLATSTDGVHFTRANNGAAILSPTPGGYDSDAIYSPSILRKADGSWFMAYAGHCYENCAYGAQIAILAATSADGYTWTKRAEPLLLPSVSPEWGVAEPALVKDPNRNTYYLYYTLVIDNPGTQHRIGVAGSSTGIEGPYTVLETAVIMPEAGLFADFDTRAVIAPFVLVESDRLRMWYIEHGPSEANWAIGYAETL